MIRENRSAPIIANSIRLHRQQDPRTVLIVEGSTDKRVFEQFIDIKKCRCIISSSREKAVQILEELEKNDFQGVIAIIDKDSDNLSEYLWNKSNLIFTDSHDLETMIINSDALKLFLLEFGLTESKKKHKNIDEFVNKIRQLLINATLPIGYLRWYSTPQKQNLQLSFVKLNFENIVDVRTITVNFDTVIVELKKVSSDCKIKDFSKIQTEIKTHIAEKTFDPWDVCSGHDMIIILTIGLKNLFGNPRCQIITVDIIDGILRLAYKDSHFQLTQVYHSIREWEKNNIKYAVLK